MVTCHGQNIRTFEHWSATVGLRADDNYLVINPFFHSFGYLANMWFPLMYGISIAYHPNPVDAKTIGELIEKYKDPREVVRHMTTGQYMKYELRGGEIWQDDELVYDGTQFMQDE